jgi:integrase/recombinase XerD
MNWAPYKKGFKAFLQLEKSLSAHSVEAYLRDIDKLTNYLESNEEVLSPADISLQHLQSFIQCIGRSVIGNLSISFFIRLTIEFT